jgi:hypothetical protein
MVTIDVERFEALIFDLDGVITQTASILSWPTNSTEVFHSRHSMLRPTIGPMSMAKPASRVC